MSSFLEIIVKILSPSGWWWFVNLMLAIILLCFSVWVIAHVVYSTQVQRLLKDSIELIRRWGARLCTIFSSPYDKNPEECRFASWFMVIFMYVLSAALFLGFCVYVMQSFSVSESTPTQSLKLATIYIATATVHFIMAKLMKVGGDKTLHALRGGPRA